MLMLLNLGAARVEAPADLLAALESEARCGSSSIMSEYLEDLVGALGRRGMAEVLQKQAV